MKKIILSAISVLALFFIAQRSFSVEEYKTESDEEKAYNVTSTVKTVQGLNFRVESDRPIEKVAGSYRPIEIDSYVALKFSKLEQKINETMSAYGKRIDELSKRVEVLEKKLSFVADSFQNQSATNP